jgi:hypothetical protein
MTPENDPPGVPAVHTQDDHPAMPVQSLYVSHHACQHPRSNAAMILFMPHTRPTGKGHAQPSPTPLLRVLPQLSRASSTSPTPGPSNHPLDRQISPDFDLSDSGPEDLAPAIAALDLEPQSYSGSGSDLLPVCPGPGPRGIVVQPARRKKGATNVWTFYEEKD